MRSAPECEIWAMPGSKWWMTCWRRGLSISFVNLARGEGDRYRLALSSLQECRCARQTLASPKLEAKLQADHVSGGHAKGISQIHRRVSSSASHDQIRARALNEARAQAAIDPGGK